MNKIVLSILTLALLAVPVAAQNSVYLNPQHSSESYCNTTEVGVWVNAANLGSGQINLTYNPDCANVTKWTRNTTNFPMGGESHYAGREWITFMALDQLTGDYMVGTLTIHCVHEEECTTPLAFADGSKLFDEGGSEISAIWVDGTFECSEDSGDTEPPYTTGHDPAPDATDVPIETNIMVHVRDDRSGVDNDTIVMTVGGDAVIPAIVGDKSDYKLVHDHEIGYGQVVNVTIDASDLAGNAMHDAYSFTIESAPPENTVYLKPQHSSTRYCNTTEVEIWVNATNQGSGQINLTYDPGCANVTKWTRNTTNFPMGGESHYAGREWITFMALDQLTGDYMVGTLTIHCVHEEECTTPLAFADGSKLFDEGGSEILAIWVDGTFGCSDTIPPSVTNPTATPTSIVADGIQTAQLNVTATDPSGIGFVTVNLSAIGGSAVQAMEPSGGDTYSTDTTASVDTPPGTYCLYVNASDVFDNYDDTSVCIELELVKYAKGDLNHNGQVADSADVAMMLSASVGDIDATSEYDLNDNSQNADSADVAMMLSASVGDITL